MTELIEIEQLVKLFNPPRDDDDSDDDCTKARVCQSEPVENSKKDTKTNPYAKLDHTQREEKEIKSLIEDDVPLSEEVSKDWKKIPKWDISYRQKVTASDVFLQMGPKTPSTASCEDMIVTIDLPGEHMQNIDIKVLQEKLEVISPNFNLTIPLPQPVHPQKGSAKWDKDLEKLTITLTMEREFDFVNF